MCNTHKLCYVEHWAHELIMNILKQIAALSAHSNVIVILFIKLLLPDLLHQLNTIFYIGVATTLHGSKFTYPWMHFQSFKHFCIMSELICYDAYVSVSLFTFTYICMNPKLITLGFSTSKEFCTKNWANPWRLKCKVYYRIYYHIHYHIHIFRFIFIFLALTILSYIYIHI